MAKTPIHVGAIHFLLWEAAEDQGGAKVLRISNAELGRQLCSTKDTMSRILAKLERAHRITLLTQQHTGASRNGKLWEISDPADFDPETEV